MTPHRITIVLRVRELFLEIVQCWLLLQQAQMLFHLLELPLQKIALALHICEPCPERPDGIILHISIFFGGHLAPVIPLPSGMHLRLQSCLMWPHCHD